MRRPAPSFLWASVMVWFFAGLAVIPVAAQSGSENTGTASTQGPTSSSQAPESSSRSAQPPKKVWTNDDLRSLRSESPISTVGKPGQQSSNVGAKPANPAARNGWYQARIAVLEAQIPPIDQKIGDLQAALSGKQVDSVRKYGWTKPDDWRVELEQLQTKRQNIQDQIATLEDRARHDGVPPNTLP